jgi:hypothetical protein
MEIFRRKFILAVAVVMAVGCSRGPLKFASLQLGSALNSDKSIATHVTRFNPDQTVHVAVLTDGPGSGDITARWMFGGRVINEETREVSYTQGAATEFHINYAGGFPEGEYKVEVLIDGMSVGTRDFRVGQ